MNRQIKLTTFKFFTCLAMLGGLTCEVFSQMPEAAAGNLKISTVKRRSFSPFRKKPNREQKKQLVPKPQDLARSSDFLRQPNTGIFKLLPDIGCEDHALIVRADEPCLRMIPESSFFSFRENEHTGENLADIRLKDGFLISDGLLSQAILTEIGDVALEKVSLNSEPLGFINSFVPQPAADDAKLQNRLLSNGVKNGKYFYRRAFPVAENTTYAMRVVAYRGSIIKSYRGYRYDILAGDKRIDLTLAFRVINKDADGSVTLLWKELSRKDAPKIKFGNRKNGKN